MSDKWYTSDNGETHLSNASIKDFWFSNDGIKFAKQLESGEQVPECNACWQEEAAGKDSKRIRDNKTYAAQKFTSTDLPIVLDLSMGNLCNIKCRICSPVHSTPWLREEAELRSPNDIKGYMKQDKYQLAIDSFAKDNDYVWEDIKDLLEHATHFDFAGGEPFYLKNFPSTVERIWKTAPNAVIAINTNGTRLLREKDLQKLKQIQGIKIRLSVDGWGPAEE